MIDGRYIKILVVEPINFMLRSAEEQYNTNRVKNDYI